MQQKPISRNLVHDRICTRATYQGMRSVKNIKSTIMLAVNSSNALKELLIAKHLLDSLIAESQEYRETKDEYIKLEAQLDFLISEFNKELD